jgi:ATP-dependent Clp protease protease subunit
VADIQVMLTGNVSEQMVSRLTAELTTRVGHGARSILIAMSTPGGSVYWGLTAYNFVRGLGVDVITHNLGQVDSIGAAIYAAGEKRLSVEQSRFLMHGISWTFAGTDPAIPEKQLRDTLAQVERDRDSLASLIATRTGTALDRVRQDMVHTTILNPSEAQKYGFVHEIKDEVFDPAQEIVNIGP